jgi:hypothetical protein
VARVFQPQTRKSKKHYRLAPNRTLHSASTLGMDYSVVYWSVAILLVLAALIGLVLPAIPSAPLIFVGLLLAVWAENFTYVGRWTLVSLALLSLLTYGVDL